MLNRLNGWQRIGTVITGLWLAFVVILGVSSALGEGPFGPEIKTTFKTVRTEVVCSNTPQRDESSQSLPASNKTVYTDADISPIGECTPGSTMIRPASERTVQIAPYHHVFFFGVFFALFLIPPLLFWVLSYASVAVFKWIAKGFHRGAT